MINQLTFHDTALIPVIQNNQTWLTSSDLAKALGYKAIDSVTKIFNRNQDEFTECMTVSGNLLKTTRTFSLRGCLLVAMFSRTKVAKEFRRWVLDILDKETQQQLPAPSLDAIITELNHNPFQARYLVTVDHRGAVLHKQDISGKSLVDAEAVRHLRHDISQMARRMSELTLRTGILSGDYSIENMRNKIN